MKYSNIYILCPANAVTGGPETLHQICDVINNHGGNAFMVYVNHAFSVVDSQTPTPYRKYNTNTTTKIICSKESLILAPETLSYSLKNKDFVNMAKGVCFLSLGFYLKYYVSFFVRMVYQPTLRYFAPLFFVYLRFSSWIRGTNNRRLAPKEMKNFKISYNCLWEKDYLEKRGVFPQEYICGPISEEFFPALDETKKNLHDENLIFYNPKKGQLFTDKIMKRYSEMFFGEDFKFIPIVSMTNKEIVDLFSKGKVYIDFGYFPGHERIPREAVLLGCNILTSNLGAAKYDDVRVPEKYKFSVKNKNIDIICRTIHELMVHAEEHYCEFDDYRRFIFEQRDLFVTNILRFVNE
jgi:hypothetical protein